MAQFFTIGVKAVIVQDNKVLVLRKVQASGDVPAWDFPGGRIEEGETIQEALGRELEEELALTEPISVGEVLGAYQKESAGKDDTALMLIFFEVEVEDRLKPVLSDEHSAFYWVDADSLETLKKEAPLLPRQEDVIRRALME